MDVATAPPPSTNVNEFSQGLTNTVKESDTSTTNQIVHSSYVPAQLHRHLQFLDFNSDGHIVLGCSDLTGRLWTGSLWYYKEPKDAPSVQKALTGVDCDSGVIDGKFIGNRTNDILVACDDGSLHYVSLSFSDEGGQESFYFLETKAASQEHEDIITALDISVDRIKVITSSYDKTVVVLDVNTLRLEERLSDIHHDIISNVAANRVNPNVIATSANDGVAAAWDLRTKDHIISNIYNDSSNWPTCIEWSPNDEFNIVIGNQSGQVQLYDIRKTGEKISSHQAIKNQITQIKFSSKRPNLFSICGDTYTLKVLELEETLNIKMRYEDNRHSDFIRGMAWQPKSDELLTCGWDHQIYSHMI